VSARTKRALLRGQYLFPAPKLSVDPRSHALRRHHVSEKNLQNAIKLAIRAAGIPKAASCHTFRFRHSPLRTRHRYSIRSGVTRAQRRQYEMIYTHVLNKPGLGILSPLDDESNPSI
jgi:integrase